jgi:hypothetical protein
VRQFARTPPPGFGRGRFLAPAEAVREAVSRVMQHAARGEVTMELERVPLDGGSDAWARLKAGASRRLVMTLQLAVSKPRSGAGTASAEPDAEVFTIGLNGHACG